MPVFVSKVYGLKQARDALGRFTKMVESKPYAVMLEESARAQEEARLETPVKSGRLQASVSFYVDPSAGLTHPTIIGTAEAHDPETGYDYSVLQHETTWFHHPNGGKDHFISDPFERMVERIDARFEKEINYD